LAVLATDVTDIRNNFIAHNTALQAGGGLWCSNKADEPTTTAYHLTNNTWLNNTALIRGGGVITNPCNVTVHGDRFLGNRALQEGGGLMVYGGQDVMLQNIQVSSQCSACSCVLCEPPMLSMMQPTARSITAPQHIAKGLQESNQAANERQ
jgi:hypothetical protein